MALRSGYKGIKKLAAGLKWNRPGVLAADDLALANVFFPRSEQAVLGAKNIIPYPYHSPNSYTSHDVGFTVNTNKTVTTDDGTASGDNAVFTLLQKSDTAFNDFFELTKGKTIKLTGVPEGASTSTYWLMIYDTSAHNLVSGEMEYQMPETMPSAFYLQIVVKNGQSASNKIWKPMISFDGGEYVPPAMTNKELTDAVKHTRTIRLENASSCTFSLPEASANNNEHPLFLALMSSTGSADVNVLAGYKITNAVGNIKTIAGAATGSFDTSTGKFTITADGAQRTLTIIANAEITV